MSHSRPASPQPAGSPVRQASGPSHRVVSTGSSYRPSEHTPSATLAIPSSRHTDLHQHLNSQRSKRNEQASREETPHRARRLLNFSSSAESRADNSERIIAKLHRKISDLRKEARGKSQAKERLRRKPEKSDRESSGTSLSAHTEVWAETPLLTEKVPSSAYPSDSVWAVKEKNKPSDRSISERRDRGVLPPSVPKKKVRHGEQGAVWKSLDLVSSSPFSEEIERAGLPERFTALRFKVYNGRTDPVAHIGHYQQRMALWPYKIR